MPSLLDYMVSQRPGLKLLSERHRMSSLLDGAAAPEPPDIFNAAGMQPALLPALQGMASMQGGGMPAVPTMPTMPAMPSVPGAPAMQGGGQPAPSAGGAEWRARQLARRRVAQQVASATEGRIPDEAVPYIQEVADEDDSEPGQQGRGFLARLIAGERVPGLSAEQNSRVKRGALLRAGLTILMGAPGGLPVIAMAILGARTQAAQHANELQAANAAAGRFQAYHEILENEDMTEADRYEKIRRLALAQSDTDTARVAADALSELREAGVQELTPINHPRLGPIFADRTSGKAFDASGRQLTADELALPQETFETRTMPDGSLAEIQMDATGRVIGQRTIQAAPAGQSEGPNLQRFEGTDPETGEPAIFAFDPSTGQVQRVEGAGAKDAGGGSGSTRDTVLGGMLPPAISTVRDYIQEHGAPARGVGALPREAQPADFQQMRDAGEQLARTYVFLLSGVTARQEEVDAAIRLFVPRPGDKRETLDAKLRRIKDFENLIANPDRWHPDARAAVSGDGEGEEDLGDFESLPDAR